MCMTFQGSCSGNTSSDTQIWIGTSADLRLTSAGLKAATIAVRASAMLASAMLAVACALRSSSADP